ncbi:dnaJ homolog subfamily B member 13-like [Oscarella lobularis]|uniref:dnaJ homolog subfamily B member 13-like n=1 Tax=Oscarella lobularis TaxID=121494 RepID=UPI003313F5E7
MGRDYYDVLALTQSARHDDVQRSYRTLSLKYHPDKNQSRDAVEKFRDISEAYDVLSDSKKRAVYDQFGEEGLKNGVPTAEPGGFTGVYTFHGDPQRTFKEFFGSENPFNELFTDGDSVMSSGAGAKFGGIMGRARPKQDPPVEKELWLSLDEVYSGCTKKLKISRRVLNDDGHTSSVKNKILSITVKPGWEEGTRILFPKEGDQEPNNIPADIVFVVKDKPHPHFKRTGCDLHYTAQVTLVQALTGCIIEIGTLDDRVISIPINEIVRPGFQKVVIGEGMPNAKNAEMRGNLVLHFDIVFPATLTPQQKQTIKQVLG